eukprot:6198861-Pleurochrysis_carterae.AAC.2
MSSRTKSCRYIFVFTKATGIKGQGHKLITNQASGRFEARSTALGPETNELSSFTVVHDDRLGFQPTEQLRRAGYGYG